MAEIRAAGVVLFRRDTGGWLYLMLTNRRHGGVGTPKGHLEPGEEEVPGAIRETCEETGIVVEPNTWFTRRIRYPVKKGLKEVVYFAAETDHETVSLSKEHSRAEWLDLRDALAAIQHGNLREVLNDAAVFLKDPLLRRDLSPADARTLCEERLEKKIVAHTAQVAAMARALAEAESDVDPDYVEACAWLHDIGRSVDHPRHPLEGFLLLAREGLGGYAPPTISHYTRGRTHDRCGPMRDELWRCCDLTSFPVEEQSVALADFLAAEDRRVTLEQRHADLSARYGASEFIDESLEICRALKACWETRTGKELYDRLGIRLRESGPGR